MSSRRSHCLATPKMKMTGLFQQNRQKIKMLKLCYCASLMSSVSDSLGYHTTETNTFSKLHKLLNFVTFLWRKWDNWMGKDVSASR